VQEFADTLNADIGYVFLFIPIFVFVTVGLVLKPDKYTWGEVKCMNGSENFV
jgi:hypothetical protein